MRKTPPLGFAHVGGGWGFGAWGWECSRLAPRDGFPLAEREDYFEGFCALDFGRLERKVWRSWFFGFCTRGSRAPAQWVVGSCFVGPCCDANSFARAPGVPHERCKSLELCACRCARLRGIAGSSALGGAHNSEGLLSLLSNS